MEPFLSVDILGRGCVSDLITGRGAEILLRVGEDGVAVEGRNNPTSYASFFGPSNVLIRVHM